MSHLRAPADYGKFDEFMVVMRSGVFVAALWLFRLVPLAPVVIDFRMVIRTLPKVM